LPSGGSPDEIHFAARQLIVPLNAARLSGYRVLTVVRNPYARIVSVWAERVWQPKNTRSRLFTPRVGFRSGMGFVEFCEHLQIVGTQIEPHLAVQVEAADAADYVLRFERLADEWPMITAAKLGRLNQGPLSTLYRKSYGAGTKTIIQQLYDVDIKRLGYRF
jgi:hypothetical protein